MDKKVFRNVGILIAVSLAALALVQASWLVRMYNDMNRSFSRQVTGALEKAAYDELITRENTKMPLGASVIRSQQFNSDSLSKFNVDSINIHSLAGSMQNISANMVDSIRISRLTSGSIIDSSRVVINFRDSIKNTALQGQMIINILSSKSIPNKENVIKCDSLLGENLLKSGILLPYRLALIENETEEEIFSVREEIPNAIHFELPADSQGRSSYVVSIPNPNRGFLREMAGILVSSILIIVLIAFAFWYLLRTLFRQKTLEKMRLDLTHNITHELKTPIAVASAAEEALTGFGAENDPQKRQQYLQVIGRQLSNLSEMVENILSMSLYEESEYRLEFEDLLLRKIVEEQASALSLTNGGKADLCIAIPDSLSVHCDKRHFSTVIKNLLDNAAKYSPGKADIHISARTKDGVTEIKVADKGIGISKQAQARIFEKFYRVPTGDRHDVKGFGLGLYYVRDMVAKHGGTITVESHEGKGTTFTIKLPQHV